MLANLMAILITFMMIGFVVWAVTLFMSQDPLGQIKAPLWRWREGAVVFKSGNGHPWTRYSFGRDITDKVVPLGAPAPPGNAKYVYFDTLAVQDGRYNTLVDTYKNQVALLIDGEAYNSEVKSDSNVEKSVVEAAKRAHIRATPRIAELDKARRLADFIDGKKNDMPLLSKKFEWVED